MGIRNLNRVFHPQSVAVVGASENPASVGTAVMENLMAAGFAGEIFAVDRETQNRWNRRTYRSVSEIRQPIDLAIIATPIESVPAIVGECAGADVGGTVIISAGGKETGENGYWIEDQIKIAARNSGLRIIGPNCLGIICNKSKLNASVCRNMPLPGRMAFISQSGAINTAVLDLSRKERVGFSYFISVGSMLDVDFSDLIDYLGNDPQVGSIVIYMEGLTRFRAFMSAARAVSRLKPIIVLKSGRTAEGARAAATHTGAPVGVDAVYDAAFQRAGILRVKTFEELFDCAEMVAKQPRPAGPGLAVITNAGAPGVMAMDTLTECGFSPAQLTEDTIAKLDDLLPRHWSRGNPVDLIDDATPDRYQLAVSVCLNAPEIDGLLVIFAPQAISHPTEIARTLANLLQKRSIPVFASWIGGRHVEQAREILNQSGIPTFDTPERAVQAFVDLYTYAKRIEMLQEIPALRPETERCDQAGAEAIVRPACKNNQLILSEYQSKKLLTAYGIPVNETLEAASPGEAVAIAERLGYPVVMKINTAGIRHKSDAHGVVLNVCNEQETRCAYTRLTEAAARHHPDVKINGVTVQTMESGYDVELIMGVNADRDFGPVILFGAGGTLAEIVQDHSMALPPLNHLLARRMIEQTQIHKAFRGYRHWSPVNTERLEEILVRLSRLAADFPEIRNVDINPLLAGGDRVCAVDAQVTLQATPLRPFDHLVISPYPYQYEKRVTLKDGTTVLVRPIKPEDAALLIRLFESLSPRSIYFRFFQPLKQLDNRMLVQFTQIDYDREIALVAVIDSGHQQEMIGVARIIPEVDQEKAEFSVVVADIWHGKGAGSALLEKCLGIAKERGVRHVWGMVLPDNTQMLALGRKIGMRRARISGSSEVELSLDFVDGAVPQ